jgi:glycosyltransferase involved in cell wall biosynthesis
MHERFIDLCAKVNIPDVSFHIWGGNSCRGTLEHQACRAGIQNKIVFRGFTNNVAQALGEIDVFGYPLREDTYAASELVIQEAMYCGVVPVVFPHGGLKRLVQDKETGLVVHTEREYAAAIEYLYNHPDERMRISENARRYARATFGAEHAAQKVHSVYQQLLQKPKSKKSLNSGNEKSLASNLIGANRFGLSLG